MYLAGDDGYMRQRSRFVEEPTILQKEADTEATLRYIKRNSWEKDNKDYRRKPQTNTLRIFKRIQNLTCPND